MSPDGEVVGEVRIDNDPDRLLREVGKAGPGAHVALEATYGWYWAVDALQDNGFVVHLAHPKGLTSFAGRRVKTDWADARELADLLRMGRFPHAYIAPVPLRELRELVRHRDRLVRVRSARKASLHAVLGKCGVIPELGGLFGPGGQKILDSLALPEPYASRVASQRRLLVVLEREVGAVEIATDARLKDDPKYQSLMWLPGIGPLFPDYFLVQKVDCS